MKIGTFVFLLMLMLIALGYFVSDSIDMRQDLNAMQAENETLRSANSQFALQLDESEQRLQQEQRRIAVLQAEKDALNLNLQENTQHVNDLYRANQYLTGEVSRLKEVNAQLEYQIDSMGQIQLIDGASNSGMDENKNILLGVSLLLPTLLIGIPTVVYYGRHMPYRTPSRSLAKFTLLTSEELHQIIQQRRRQ
jgi:hypothetical protein